MRGRHLGYFRQGTPREKVQRAGLPTEDLPIFEIEKLFEGLATLSAEKKTSVSYRCLVMTTKFCRDSYRRC